MLGHIARWLRLLGFDTQYHNDISDRDLLHEAQTENRILITADCTLYNICVKHHQSAIFVTEAELETQIINILNTTQSVINPESFGSRCSKCNSLLQKVSKEEILQLLSTIKPIPDAILHSQKLFWVCSGCKQAYWPGRMWDRILHTTKKFTTLPQTKT